MQVITAHRKIQSLIQEAKASRKTIGFVPTMGALHDGHASLVEQAIKDCALVVVSVFVNPTQFNNVADLETYPRTLEKDVAFLSTISDQIIVYAPTAKEVYGNTVASTSYNFGELEQVMEGAHRPGHFDGVGTVVNILFKQVSPDKAYFGEKDFQQLAIIRRLVEIEKLDLQIIGCPIHRETNGLAMSSRNTRLTPQQLLIAPQIYQTLQDVKKRFETHSATELKTYVSKEIDSIEGLELEYFEISNARDLQPLSRKRTDEKYRAFIAVYAGEVRLIDNIALN